MKKILLLLLIAFNVSYGQSYLKLSALERSATSGSLIVTGTSGVPQYTPTIPLSKITGTNTLEPKLNGTGFVVATGTTITYDATQYATGTGSADGINTGDETPDRLALIVEDAPTTAPDGGEYTFATDGAGVGRKHKWTDIFTFLVTPANIGAYIHGLTNKTTPTDSDEFGLVDVSASNVEKKVTFTQSWTNYYKGKADALYQPLNSNLTSWAAITRASGFDTWVATPSSANLQSLLTTKTGTGNVVFSAGATLSTPTLGVASSTSENITGTGGNGFLELGTQTSTVSAGGTNSVRLYSNAGNFSWTKATDGFSRGFSSTLTANRTYTLPDASGNLALLSQTITNGTTGTAPSEDAVYDALDTKIFTIAFETGAISPADATTYYFSDVRIVPNTTASNFSFNLGFNYTIVGIKLGVGLNSTVGSTENNTLQVRNVTQATSTSVGTFTTDGSTTLIKSATFTGLNISVASGDAIALQWDTPNWATNPVGTLIFATLICKRQ